MSGRLTRAKALLGTLGWHAPVDPATEALVQAHFSALRASLTRFILTSALVLNVLWFLTDELTVGHLPGAVEGLNRLRLGVLTAGVLGLAVLWRQPTLEGPRLWLSVAIWLAEFAWFGAGTARIADISKPWFYFLLPLLMTTDVLPLGMRRRILITGLMAIAILAGFVAARPETLESAYFPMALSYLIFTFGVSVAFGERVEHVTRRAFLNRLQAEAATAQVEREREGLKDQVSIQTDELHRLASHLDQTSEAERERIARELHDDVGQTVTALRLSMATTLRRFAREPSAIAVNLDDLDTLIGRVAEGTRDAVTRLRPRLLDDRGLASAVEWLVATTARQCDLDLSLSLEGDIDRLEPSSGEVREATASAIACFRVLQEALSNAIRHAGATRVTILLSVVDERLILRVDDDGRGIDTRHRTGLGLLTMRERARSVGGTMTVERRPSGGTRVRCELPLEGDWVTT